MGKRSWSRVFFLSALCFPSLSYAAQIEAGLRLKLVKQSIARETSTTTFYIEANDRTALAAALTERHLSFGETALGLFWVHGSLADVAALASHPAADRLGQAPRLHPLLDQSVHVIGADAVHRGTGIAQALSGKDVLIGVLDTGIDLHHPAFLGSDGKPRIEALWDQDGNGNPPAGYGFGTLCSHDDIVNETCTEIDSEGHGTHVAGILAGSMAPHVGLAPAANLVVARSNDFTDVAAAVQWMFSVADAQGKPMVVNLSLGGHLGAHDGQSALERSLDKMQGPGHIIVTAAGNDGDTTLHLHDSLSGDPHRAEMSLPPSGSDSATTFELWGAPGAKLNLVLEVRDMDGNLTASIPLHDEGNGQDDNVASSDGTLHGHFSYAEDLPNAQNKIHQAVVIDRAGQGDSTANDRWFIVTNGSGEFDAWLATDSDDDSANFNAGVDPAIPSMVAGDATTTITIPGTAAGVITVGSFVTKNTWASEIGRNYSLPDTALLSLSSFSSQGPTAAPSFTGAKPDLVAPGQLIAAPLSSSARDIASLLAIDTNFAVMQGTSMSAPHVAGTIALMLQVNPKLDAATAKRILQATASAMTDGSSQAGAGRLNAAAAIIMLEGTTPKNKGCQATGETDLAGLALLFIVLSFRHARRARFFAR